MREDSDSEFRAEDYDSGRCVQISDFSGCVQISDFGGCVQDCDFGGLVQDCDADGLQDWRVPEKHHNTVMRVSMSASRAEEVPSLPPKVLASTPLACHVSTSPSQDMCPCTLPVINKRILCPSCTRCLLLVGSSRSGIPTPYLLVYQQETGGLSLLFGRKL